MGACAEYEEQVSLHAAGALEGEEAARVRAHLETCAACRREAAAVAEVLALAALPPPTPAEQRELEALPERTRAAWRREQARRGLGRRALGGLMAAAAGVALMLAVASRGGHLVSRTVTALTPAPAVAGEALDEETLAAFEAWAGLEPLAEASSAADTEGLAGDDEDDLSLTGDDWDTDFNLGETL